MQVLTTTCCAGAADLRFRHRASAPPCAGCICGAPAPRCPGRTGRRHGSPAPARRARRTWDGLRAGRSRWAGRRCGMAGPWTLPCCAASCACFRWSGAGWAWSSCGVHVHRRVAVGEAAPHAPVRPLAGRLAVPSVEARSALLRPRETHGVQERAWHGSWVSKVRSRGAGGDSLGGDHARIRFSNLVSRRHALWLEDWIPRACSGHRKSRPDGRLRVRGLAPNLTGYNISGFHVPLCALFHAAAFGIAFLRHSSGMRSYTSSTALRRSFIMPLHVYPMSTQTCSQLLPNR